jgi:hypothetical protein
VPEFVKIPETTGKNRDRADKLGSKALELLRKSKRRAVAGLAVLAVATTGSAFIGSNVSSAEAHSGTKSKPTKVVKPSEKMASKSEVTAYETKLTDEIVAHYKDVSPNDRLTSYGGDHILLQETIDTKSKFSHYDRGAYVLQLYTSNGAKKIDGSDVTQVIINEEAYAGPETGYMTIYEQAVESIPQEGGWAFNMSYHDWGNPYFDLKHDPKGPTQAPLTQEDFIALSTQGQKVVEKAFHHQETIAEPLVTGRPL